MKLLLFIWLVALGACIGTYAYIYVSISQMVEAQPVYTSGSNQTYNPQLTIDGKKLQGGN